MIATFGSGPNCTARSFKPGATRYDSTAAMTVQIARIVSVEALGWIVARIVEVPGALSQGRTREEARENLIDALRLMLSPDDDDAAAAAGRSEPLDLIVAG